MSPVLEDPYDALVIRTAFTDEQAWLALCKTLRNSGGEFPVRIKFVSDNSYSGWTAERVAQMAKSRWPKESVVFIADDLALDHPEHPLLAIDLIEDSARVIRAVPSAVHVISACVDTGSLGFEDFERDIGIEGMCRDSF